MYSGETGHRELQYGQVKSIWDYYQLKVKLMVQLYYLFDETQLRLNLIFITRVNKTMITVPTIQGPENMILKIQGCTVSHFVLKPLFAIYKSLYPH